MGSDMRRREFITLLGGAAMRANGVGITKSVVLTGTSRGQVSENLEALKSMESPWSSTSSSQPNPARILRRKTTS
jgi:hypothetical protein